MAAYLAGMVQAIIIGSNNTKVMDSANDSAGILGNITAYTAYDIGRHATEVHH